MKDLENYVFIEGCIKRLEKEPLFCTLKEVKILSFNFYFIFSLPPWMMEG